MKLSPFTLVYQPQASASAPRARAANAPPDVIQVPDLKQRLQDIRQSAPDVAAALDAINNPHLTRTLIASTYAHETAAAALDESVEDKLRQVVTDLRRESKVVTAAIWDLGARIGGLGRLINALNAAQPAFTFFELQAPFPAGLVIQSDSFSLWARKRLKKRVSKSDREEFTNNFMFNDFERFARVVHKQSGVDYLIGVTPYMVAWTKGVEAYWNYFVASDKKVILVSTYSLREYAAQAGRPFEVAAAGLVLAEVLALLNKRVEYHKVNRGCLFDFNGERDTIVESIRQMRIEPVCLDKIDKKYRDAAVALVDALRDYSPGEAAPAKKAAPKKGQDDEYWLTRLAKLSGKLSKG